MVGQLRQPRRNGGVRERAYGAPMGEVLGGGDYTVLGVGWAVGGWGGGGARRGDLGRGGGSPDSGRGPQESPGGEGGGRWEPGGGLQAGCSWRGQTGKE